MSQIVSDGPELPASIWAKSPSGEKSAVIWPLADGFSAFGTINHLTEEHTMTEHITHAVDTGDELLTIDEAAALVRAPVATLRYWRHLGTGPHSFRVGRAVRYWRRDVLAWLTEQTIHSGPPRLDAHPLTHRD